MKRVWTELQKQRRKGGGFMYPAWSGSNPRSTEVQQEAMGCLWFRVAGNAGAQISTRTRKAVDADEDHLSRAVNQLHDIAREILFLAPFNAEEIKSAASSLSAEIEKRRTSGMGNIRGNLITERDRGDPELRGLARVASQACLRIFGKHLYSTVATICNVALDRDDIGGPNVRALVRE
jgi:hypothetical protein